jgi:hypothetical protein
MDLLLSNKSEVWGFIPELRHIHHSGWVRLAMFLIAMVVDSSEQEAIGQGKYGRGNCQAHADEMTFSKLRRIP